jgi:serpin B
MRRPHALLAILFLALLPCRAAEPAPVAAAEAGDRLNRLGLALLSGARGTGAGNVAVSPWPTYRSLSLAYLGARGETQKEIAKALLAEDPAADVLDVRQQLAKAILAWNDFGRGGLTEGSKFALMEWNDLSTVWVTHRAVGRAEYLDAVKKVPGTVVRAVDFSNPGKAQVDINDGVSEATKGKIPRLLPPGAIDRDTRFVLASTLSFKAPWPNQFEAKETRFEPFWIGGSKSERVPTMIAKQSFRSLDYEDFTVLGLPVGGFVNPSFQLLIFLPKKVDGLPAVEQLLNPMLLREWTTMDSSVIELHLPRFHVLASPLKLKESLRAIGIHAAFEQKHADFSGMCSTPVWLDAVFDACEFSIDEKGLSGADAMVMVVTSFGARPGPLKADTMVRVDRPFAFALQHIPSSTCLFLGRVRDPR